MVEATIERRDDIRRIWWLTVEYPTDGEPLFQDELHIELVNPPGRYGAEVEYFRGFEWFGSPLGRLPTWTFTPRQKLPQVRAVAELVAGEPL
jgi:hypothetical protein